MKNKKKILHDENSDKLEDQDEMGYNEDYNPLDRWKEKINNILS